MKAPGLEAVLAPKLAKLDEDVLAPKLNVGEALEEDEPNDDPNAGVDDLFPPDEAPNENAGVVVDDDWLLEAAPNPNAGAAAFGASDGADAAGLSLVAPKLTGMPPKEKPPVLEGRSSFGAPGMLRVASAFFLSSSDVELLTGLPPNEKPPAGSEKEGGLTVDGEDVFEPVTTTSSSSSSWL